MSDGGEQTKRAATKQVRAEIDRIEDGGVAVLVVGDDRKTQVDVPASLLPEGASDGDHLRITITLDKEGGPAADDRREGRLRGREGFQALIRTFAVVS